RRVSLTGIAGVLVIGGLDERSPLDRLRRTHRHAVSSSHRTSRPHNDTGRHLQAIQPRAGIPWGTQPTIHPRVPATRTTRPRCRTRTTHGGCCPPRKPAHAAEPPAQPVPSHPACRSSIIPGAPHGSVRSSV